MAQVEHSATERIEARRPKEQEEAASLIQRHYRGYRERRQLNGRGLDANTRWAEALRDAKWRNTTRPTSRSEYPKPSNLSASPEERARASSDAARRNWKRIGAIARRAGADDPEDASSSDDQTAEERAESRKKREQAKAEREQTAKMMDLQYFLEMVDQKHRYGSNLRAYHEHWKKAETNENFFYWLDNGSGKHFELPTVSRERLESEQVRYLSREERLNYLVKIDKQGRLCWVKNGERICTSMNFKDSVNGIVPLDDNSPTYGPNGQLHHDDQSRNTRPASTASLTSSTPSQEESDAEAEHYVNEDLHKAKGLSKIKYVSAATVLNHLLRGTVKPNSWIFVADTSFRLYVGIKQSGAFQHSSFLHGARISAAGLIKIKDGQLRRLSPLSGHYRPPTKNFRAFVHSLQENGVDMSRVSISRSYAVLVGLEVYVKSRRKLKAGIKHIQDTETKVMHPEEHERRVAEQKDNSKSAEKERQLLAQKAEQEAMEKKEKSLPRRIWRRLSRAGSGSQERSKENPIAGKKATLELEKEKELSKAGQDVEDVMPPKSKPGQDVEDAIPPQGKRDELDTDERRLAA